MLCPRCQRPQEDGLEECRACGVVFSRYRPRPEAAPAAGSPWLAWLQERMFAIEPAERKEAVVARGVFLLILACVALGILLTPMQGPALMSSFIHWIDLPFHEAGHVVFSPFGTFLHILGGTLGQLLVPFIVIAAFLKEENPFGAAAGTGYGPIAMFQGAWTTAALFAGGALLASPPLYLASSLGGGRLTVPYVDQTP